MATKSRAPEAPTRALDAPEGPPSLAAVLRQLQDQKGTLDKLDDRIADAIRKVENVMRQFVGIRTTTLMHHRENDGFQSLTFGKLRNAWHLLVEDGHIDHDGDVVISNTTALVNCSRQKRAEVFADGHLEALLRTAHEKFSTEIADREQAMERAENILAALSHLVVPEQESQPESSGAPDDDIPF